METSNVDKKNMFPEISVPAATRDRRIVFTLAVAVLVLALSFVVFVLCATIYISNTDRTSSDNDGMQYDKPENKFVQTDVQIPPREFYIEVPRVEFTQTFMVYQYIRVDEQLGIEYIVFKDPDMLHIQDIVFVDHVQGIQVLYSSETAQCYFARERKHSFARNVRFLWQNNGTNISVPVESHDYRPGSRLVSMENIPVQLAAFCSLSNSYWLDDRTSYEWKEEDRYHVCICSYFYCWCTYCPKPNCWGRCCQVDDSGGVWVK